MRPAVGKLGGDLRGCGAVSKSVLDNRRWKEKQSPGEDDWHHAGVVHFQRHVLRLAAVHFAPDHALGVLHSNLSHALGDRDHPSDDNEQERYHEHKNGRVDLASSCLR